MPKGNIVRNLDSVSQREELPGDDSSSRTEAQGLQLTNEKSLQVSGAAD